MPLADPSFVIRPARQTELPAISRLVWDAFLDKVAADVGEFGMRMFAKFITLAALRERWQADSEFWVAIATQNSHPRKSASPVGVLEVNANNHIYLFFVATPYQRRGIGRALFETLLETRTGRFTANASRYALPIYLRLGFTWTEAVVTRNGLTVYPVVFETKFS